MMTLLFLSVNGLANTLGYTLKLSLVCFQHSTTFQKSGKLLNV